ncbi:hypothetical protein [Klebsiella phage vB_KpnS-VAC6]|uniref:Uncharacterized protein n=1 Tax=Klebsiella phage vB_KpnS-VAC6 TaxID=2864364 RepID=A0AAE7XI55_9CAUD|nr:hypothetical protein [Klebsiella phage vB_KpnS-VAC6]
MGRKKKGLRPLFHALKKTFDRLAIRAILHFVKSKHTNRSFT